MLPVAATTSFLDGLEGSGSDGNRNVFSPGGDIRGCDSSKSIVPGYDAAHSWFQGSLAASIRVHVLTRQVAGQKPPKIAITGFTACVRFWGLRLRSLEACVSNGEMKSFRQQQLR